MGTNSEIYLKSLCVANEQGATAIFVAVVMLAMIGMASFAVDIGYIAVTKNELQSAADAAALASARRLGLIYEGMNVEEQQSYFFDPNNPQYSADYDDIIAAAGNVVGEGKNTVSGKKIGIRSEDIKINVWNGTEFSTNSWEDVPFQPPPPDAVKVTTRRDNLNNGPISTFFARIFGVDEVEVKAVATAALTNGSLNNPVNLEGVGVSSEHFDSNPNYCGDDVDFSLCVAKFSVPADPGEVQIGVPFVFSSAVDDSEAVFQSDGTISVVVFEKSEDTDDCGNQNLHVVGFAEMEIDVDVGTGSISRTWKCSFYSGRGYGNDFPLKGTIPALVQ